MTDPVTHEEIGECDSPDYPERGYWYFVGVFVAALLLGVLGFLGFGLSNTALTVIGGAGSLVCILAPKVIFND